RARVEVQAAEQRRRRRALAVAGGVLVAVLALGIVGTTLGLVRALAAGKGEGGRAGGGMRGREGEGGQRRVAQGQPGRAARAGDEALRALDVTTTTITGESLATQKSITPEQKQFLTEVLPVYRRLAREKADDEKTRAQVARAAMRVGLIAYRVGSKA